MKKFLCVMLTCVLSVGVADAATFSDNFDALPVGNLEASPNYERANGGHSSEEVYAGFPGLVITDSSNDGGNTYNGGPVTGQTYVGMGPATAADTYQRVSIDFQWGTSGPGNILTGVGLNFDPATQWASDPIESSAYIARTNGDVLFFSKRNRTSGEYVIPGGPWHQINPDLARDTWYTLELENDNWNITASVYPQGSNVPLLSVSFFDDGVTTGGARMEDGFPSFWTGGGPPAGWSPPQKDNFVYERIPEPATMSLLGLGGLAMLRRKR